MSSNQGQQGDRPALGGGLQEVGRRLKEARAKRGWSLQQVAERIHVAIRYLDAIENGDPAGVPAIVYIRGFVINYARILGLDEETILRVLDEGGGVTPGYIPAESPTSRTSAREKARVSISPDFRRNLAIIAVVVVAGVLVGLVIRGVAGKFAGRAGVGVPPSPFDSSPANQAGRRSEAKPVEKPSKVDGLRQVAVSVTATQDCWMQVQVDDGKTEDIDLKPGMSRWFAGAGRVRLFIGNAAGVSLTGPQGPIEMPGKPGRVVHILVTRGEVQRLKIPVSPPQSSTVPR